MDREMNKTIDQLEIEKFSKIEKHRILEIGAGLGPLAGKVWRIGLMGYSCNRKNIALCLHALNEAIEINRG